MTDLSFNFMNALGSIGAVRLVLPPAERTPPLRLRSSLSFSLRSTPSRPPSSPTRAHRPISPPRSSWRTLRFPNWRTIELAGDPRRTDDTPARGIRERPPTTPETNLRASLEGPPETLRTHPATPAQGSPRTTPPPPLRTDAPTPLQAHRRNPSTDPPYEPRRPPPR